MRGEKEMGLKEENEWIWRKRWPGELEEGSMEEAEINGQMREIVTVQWAVDSPGDPYNEG
jgi:hypothetical protein